MGLLAGKNGVIMGVANNRSIATAIADFAAAEGASLAFSYLPDGTGKMEQRVLKSVQHLDPALVAPCDVNNDEDISTFFNEVRQVFPKIDFLVHSIAFAPLEDIRTSTLFCSRKGFNTAMNTSVYSFIATSRNASSLMSEGSSILTLSYFGGEKVVAGYNMMGIAKAALECTVRYLAFELGEKGIRVNSLSAGAIKTLASSAIGDFSAMMQLAQEISPLKRNVTIEEIAKSAVYLLSNFSSGCTGETHHVDGGYNIMGSFSNISKGT